MSEQGPLVLIVEDEAPLRRFLRAALVAQGYRLVEAENATEGLQRATEHNPDIAGSPSARRRRSRWSRSATSPSTSRAAWSPAPASRST
jgi:hypothetical protein